jgi:hypothetical protein
MPHVALSSWGVLEGKAVCDSEIVGVSSSWHVASNNAGNVEVGALCISNILGGDAVRDSEQTLGAACNIAAGDFGAGEESDSIIGAASRTEASRGGGICSC